MPEFSWNKIEDIFSEAVELQETEREKFLREKCGSDKELYLKITALIKADERAEKYLDSPIELPKTLGNLLSVPAETVSNERSFGVYRVIRKLGMGGMGDVYLAERSDGEFNRKVAVKLIKKDLVTEFNLHRFRRERQILATLEHPNIACLLDGGTTEEGLPYLVMEYINGEALLDYCRKNKLNLAERLEIFLDICSAVDYAHHQNVIHRDIKPSNILMTSSGTPKLLDFGIAKILDSDVERDLHNPTISLIQQMTPEYASPEQIKNETITEASDIYSLGVVLYELLTGKRPYKFKNRSPYEIARVICEEEILSPNIKINNARILDFEVEDILYRALQKKPEKRFASIKDFSHAVKSYLTKQHTVADFESVTEEFETPAFESSKSIAVAPLTVSEKKENKDSQYYDEKFLGVGLADALTTRLSRVSGLIVRPTSSVLRFSGASDIAGLGRALGVSFLLSGNIIRTGNQFRVVIQLLDVKQNKLIWASTFDESENDIFQFQDLITEKTIAALLPEITAEKNASGKNAPNPSADAYKAYLRGRYYWNSYTTEGILKSEQYFKQAISLDPNFALAHSGLADFYNWLGVAEISLPKPSFAEAKKCALRALELDSELAEAYSSLAFAVWASEWNFTEAERLYKKALKINGNYSKAHEWYAYLLSSAGRHDEAIRQMEIVQTLDPNSPAVLTMHSYCLYNARRFEESVEVNLQALKIDPNHSLPLQGLGWVFPPVGRFEEAVEGSRKAVSVCGETPLNKVALTLALIASNELEEAQELISDFEQQRIDGHLPAYFLGLCYAVLNENDKAFDWLDIAFDEGGYWSLWLAVEPRLDSLRKDPRFIIYENRLKFSEKNLQFPTHGGDKNVTSRIAQKETQNLNLPIPDSYKSKVPLIALGIAVLLLTLTFVGMNFWKAESPEEVKKNVASNVPKSVNTLVILPFRAPDGASNILSHSLAEELISNLGRFKKLSVISINKLPEAFTTTNLTSIKSETNADFFLLGEIQSSGANRQLNVELQNAQTGNILWKEKFAIGSENSLILQSQISERVLNALTIELTGSEREFIAKPYTKDSEAFQFYIVARSQFAARTIEEVEKAFLNFKSAVESDPQFALAYTGLADTQIVLAQHYPKEAANYYDRAETFALKALSIDPDLAEAHNSLGMIYSNRAGQQMEAEKHFKRAIELNPSLAAAHHWYSLMLKNSNRLDEALSEINKAAVLEPRSVIIQLASATLFASAEQYTQALSSINKAIEIDNSFVQAYHYKSWLLQGLGDYQGALNTYQNVRIYVRSPQNELDWLTMKAQARAAGGYRHQTLEMLDEIFKNSHFKKSISVQAAEIALIYHLLGETDEAFSWLRKLSAETAAKTNLRKDFRFKDLHSDPRFDKIFDDLK